LTRVPAASKPKANGNLTLFSLIGGELKNGPDFWLGERKEEVEWLFPFEEY
jgi:hypothetical protein